MSDQDRVSQSQSGMEKDAARRLFAGLRAGDPRSIARAVSLVENCAPSGAAILSLCRHALEAASSAFRVGITGPAGAGKSTLVDGLARELRAAGRRVGIVAVDPSSSISGGAILGDRIRMDSFASDPGVYIRSMASRGQLGGVSRATNDVLDVIEASWPDAERAQGVLMIETVGVGQAEVEIAGVADAVVVVLSPGMGDSIQSLKAGVLEIASVFALNKADLEGIEQLEADIEELLGLSTIVAPGRDIPEVVKTVATKGAGIAVLWTALQALPRKEERKTREPGKDSPKHRTEPARLDHLGIAVRSLDSARAMYEVLGIPVSPVEEVKQERVRVAMLATGEGRIELLEATTDDSVIGRFVARHGEGLHHIALCVSNLDETVLRLKQTGVRLVSETIQVGAGGHRYVFVHPASANGVLLELVEGDAR